MALIFSNSVCPLCNELLGEDIIAFPRMIENSADELLFADDAAFDRICIERHRLYERLMCRLKLWDEASAANLASHHECLFCKKSIVDPDDCYNFGFLTYDRRSPLWYLNYSECHENCLCSGVRADYITNSLNDLVGSPDVSPIKLAELMKRLKTAPDTRREDLKP